VLAFFVFFGARTFIVDHLQSCWPQFGLGTPMPDIDVKVYLDQLRRDLPYVPPIPVKKIKALHKNGGLGSVVKLIRKTMNVDVGLTIHWTSGPPPIPGATAWIRLPEKMPRYGTAAFKELKLDIFILKSFAETATYDQFVIVVAHELGVLSAAGKRSHFYF
jgi:hypothetical protein